MNGLSLDQAVKHKCGIHQKISILINFFQILFISFPPYCSMLHKTVSILVSIYTDYLNSYVQVPGHLIQLANTTYI